MSGRPASSSRARSLAQVSLSLSTIIMYNIITLKRISATARVGRAGGRSTFEFRVPLADDSARQTSRPLRRPLGERVVRRLVTRSRA